MPEVAVTFDNGPHARVTPRVLDVLRDRDVRATFFLVGRALAAPGARALAERAREAGHWIGNHTLSHGASFGAMTDAARRRREIEEAQAMLGDLAHPDRLFRPVGDGGRLDRRLLTPDVLETLESGAYTCVTWNAVPRDWEDPDGWVDRALAQCAGQAETLLVLHDLPTGAMDHLATFFDRADGAGLTFRQAFPETCVLLRRGEVTGRLDGLVGEPA